MKIIFIASEVSPYAKTGGLGDVTGSLPLELQELGHEVSVFLPFYKSVDFGGSKPKKVIDTLKVLVGTKKEEGALYELKHASGVVFYFVEQSDLFGRDELYGTSSGDYPDNDHRFIFFQRAVLESMKSLKMRPEIIHCHDWQTGLIPIYLKTLYARNLPFKKSRVVFTVHNLAYQGNFPPDSLPLTGLGWDYFTVDSLEFYGKVNFLKGGVLFADSVTTVSKSYGEEVQTKELGCGLEGVFKKRKKDLHGIVNGIDFKDWNPEKDKVIAASYHLKDRTNKAKNKEALQEENHFEVDPNKFVLGLVSRLVDQKGIDILISAMDQLAVLGVQLVLLGTGEEKYHQALRDLAKQYRNQFGFHIVFDPHMARRIYAGSDALLVPSYYEPCGLSQMIALRYGTIPVVRTVGGLADTVQEFDAEAETGNGFCFDDYTARAMIAALRRCLQVYEKPAAWQSLMRNAMACDYSWSSSAKQYLEVYEQTERQPLSK